ncbi:BadF/BadG/BcrA/BcrD ATPase family protein [Sphingomonas sp. URHD0057]|uniref:BadF/BadG/BcrA/BcrD ATPase family protein n=1 Tax=Sphingomonas sp. URHD0057 TaxID=1380389 RepID=UPI000491F37E|nr:BadF/BadG/BcrA/BcrD ATPase family protein [Sphingomonas sp. URHD0057]
MGFYLGIDAGGTRTTARLVSGSGETLGTGEAGPANTRIGFDNALREVESACAHAIEAAGLSEAEVGSIRAGLGIAGLNRRGALEALQAHHFPFASIAFASDAAIACLGAHAGGDGGIVIVGTGSIGFARVAGETVIVGGYGFPISDEGSGADLGLRAIQQSLWARDRRIAHSAMTREILERFSDSAGEIVTWMDSATATDYAVFSPLVMEHASRGDAVAEPIVQEAARGVDRLIRVLFERGAPHCCLMGGVSEVLYDWLAAGLRKRLREPLGNGLDGALLLAHSRDP